MAHKILWYTENTYVNIHTGETMKYSEFLRKKLKKINKTEKYELKNETRGIKHVTWECGGAEQTELEF